MIGVRIYIEGGGDDKDTKAAIRSGFSAFLSDLREVARQRLLDWYVVACGSRGSAFDAFQTACRKHTDSFVVLLVDSEGPVSASPRRHLRDGDGWRIEQADEHCHLMAQTMEAWIVADVGALRGFYGQGFQESAIPRTQDVEQIDKDELVPSLRRASRSTQKGSYHKIRHGARLLGRLDPATVRSRATHCERLFATLLAVIEGEGGEETS